MIESSEMERFLYKHVAIGVPHDVIPGKLFFYFGILKYCDFTEVKLELDYNKGYKIVPIASIRDIHETHGNGGVKNNGY